MEKILQMKISDVPGSHKTPHDGYDFYKHNLVPREIASQCTVAVYEIMPGKSAVPYHYHLKNEETYPFNCANFNINYCIFSRI